MEAQVQEAASGIGSSAGMDVKVEIGEEAPVRTSVPTLDDVMTKEDLATITAEGLALNPEMSDEELKQANERAQQLEAYQNYLKQQRFMQFMNARPQPATLQKADWGLLRYLMIIHEKAEFDGDETIKALTDDQWYHGIITGNVRVFKVKQDDGSDVVQVSLRQKYRGLTMNLLPPEGWVPPQTRAQKRSTKKLH